jgi:hypothetical protein
VVVVVGAAAVVVRVRSCLGVSVRVPVF